MFKFLKRRLYRALASRDVFNNSLSPKINIRYSLYADECRKQSRQLSPDEQLFQKRKPILEPTRFESIIPRNEALSLSDKVSQIVDEGNKVKTENDNPVFIGIPEPISLLGEDVINIFDNQELDARIKKHFGGYYRVAWLDCYRTVPSLIRKQAWLWHSDNVPARLLKVQLLLTDADRHNGAINMLSHKDTLAFRHAGYFGDLVAERLPDLSEFAQQCGVAFNPICCEAKAGDVLLFDNNDLHCAMPPERNYRDALTFLLLPSSKPWNEVYRRNGKASVEKNPGGYPLWPEQTI